MQAPLAHAAHAHTPVTTPSVTGALRAVEAFLLRGGQQTARRNAWTAVLEDRKRAKDRHEVQHLLETLGAPTAPLGTAIGGGLGVVRNPVGNDL